jgi:hypothetical protein
MAKSKRLPGMSDAKIETLQDAAASYADIRDKRQVLTAEESTLKQSLITLMHKHHKDHYEFDGVVIDLVMEEETVKVKIKKHKEDDEDNEEPS